MHYQNLPEWEQYLTSLEAGKLPLSRAMKPSPRQLLIRELILLLKKGTLDVNYFRNKFGVDVLDEYRDVWNEYRDENLLTYDHDTVTLTRNGLLCVDGLLPQFFEPEMQGVRYT